MQVPAPFDYRGRPASTTRSHSSTELGPESRRDRRRPQPAADDEAAAGRARAPDRHQRPLRPALHPSTRATSSAIGAMTRHRDLLASALIGEHFPIVRDAERVIADPLVRNRGTIGGALCQADPSEDLSAVCAALGADVRDPAARAASASSRCTEFHRGPVRDRGRAGRAAHRGAVPDPRRRRQRLREGRAPGRRLGGRRRRRRAVAGRRHDRRRPASR